jgi:hypothetical protein
MQRFDGLPIFNPKGQPEGFSTYEKQVRFNYSGKLSLVCLERNFQKDEKIEREIFHTTDRFGSGNMDSATCALFWALVAQWIEGTGTSDVIPMIRKLF